MALAFTSLTRVDILVYITALQRVAQTPTVLHVRRLNAIVRWTQRNRNKLEYLRMKCQQNLEGHSDAGFRREATEDGEEGRANHGCNYIRIGEAIDRLSRIGRLVDWSNRGIKQVTRSTFTSETLGVVAAADNGLVLTMMLSEIKHGPIPARELARLSTEAGLCFKLSICTDALNLI